MGRHAIIAAAVRASIACGAFLASAASMPAFASDAVTLPGGFFVSGSIDGVLAHRNTSSGPIVIPTAGPGTIVDADDFSLKNGSGADARLRIGYGQWSLEGRFLGNFQKDSAIPNLGAVGNVRIGSFSNFGATAFEGSASTKMQAWELNLRWQAQPWFTPFIGYRELKLSDHTALTITFPAFNAVYNFSTPWLARGVQIGADLRLLGPGTSWQPGPFFFDLDARVGLFHVSADSAFALLPSTGGSFTGGSSFSKNASVISEFGATVGYQFTPNWDIHAGYRLLIAQNVVTANDYAVAATAQSTQSAVPSGHQMTMNMFTVGTRFTF